MTTEQLKAAANQRPFKPFRVHLADERALQVLHPEFLAFFPSGRTAIVFTTNDGYEVIDLLLVSSIEVLPGSASAA